jgi:hypothetical protein
VRCLATRKVSETVLLLYWEWVRQFYCCTESEWDSSTAILKSTQSGDSWFWCWGSQSSDILIYFLIYLFIYLFLCFVVCLVTDNCRIRSASSTVLQSVHTGDGKTQTPIQWISEAIYSLVKQLEREAYYSAPPIVDVTNEWSNISIAPYAFIAYFLNWLQRQFDVSFVYLF